MSDARQALRSLPYSAAILCGLLAAVAVALSAGRIVGAICGPNYSVSSTFGPSLRGAPVDLAAAVRACQDQPLGSSCTEQEISRALVVTRQRSPVAKPPGGGDWLAPAGRLIWPVARGERPLPPLSGPEQPDGRTESNLSGRFQFLPMKIVEPFCLFRSPKP